MIGQHFNCNICGAPNSFKPDGDWREAPSCTTCSSSVRMRSIVHCLSMGLFGASHEVGQFPKLDIVGVGLSDWEGYAERLAERFRYTNSYYHQEPRLDITRPTANWLNSSDFLISTDVFEHVPVPASSAFAGAASVLKKGGLLIITVPYMDNPTTIEHFPHMKDFAVVDLGEERVMINRDANGEVTVHRDLTFHGGDGSTLEMRVFSRDDIFAHLHAAGFEDVRVHEDDIPRWGIFNPHHYGLPITARRS